MWALTDHRPVFDPVFIQQVADVLRWFTAERRHRCDLILLVQVSVLCYFRVFLFRLAVSFVCQRQKTTITPPARPGSSFCGAVRKGRSCLELEGRVEAGRQLTPPSFVYPVVKNNRAFWATLRNFRFGTFFFYGFFYSTLFSEIKQRHRLANDNYINTIK